MRLINFQCVLLKQVDSCFHSVAIILPCPITMFNKNRRDWIIHKEIERKRWIKTTNLLKTKTKQSKIQEKKKRRKNFKISTTNTTQTLIFNYLYIYISDSLSMC